MITLHPRPTTLAMRRVLLGLVPLVFLIATLGLATGAAAAETLTVVAQINFQSQGAPVPAGWVADVGQAFDASRGYGWVAMSSTAPLSLVGNGRDRNTNPDQRLDTFVHMQLGQGAGVPTPGRWEHTVANGTYELSVSVGDAGKYLDSAHSITVEATPMITRFVPTSTTKFRTATTRVTVTDGRLTLSPAGGTNTKIDSVTIKRVDTTTPPSGPTLSMALHPGTAQKTLYADTQSLSFEVLDMALPQFSTGNLRAYLTTLGPAGTLRIGGNSADQTFWTSSDEPPPSWSTATITPAALSRLGDLLRATGWNAVLTLNLKHPDPARAADEAVHASTLLGPSLAAVELGNEPDMYGISEDTYWQRYLSYRSAITAKAPTVTFVAPGMSNSGNAFQSAFVDDQARSSLPISALTRHFYSLSACQGKVPTLTQLLSKDVYSAQKTAGATLVNQANRLGVPAWMDETNNVVCQGQPGVSDTFGAALWTIDHLMALSQAGVRQIHLHGNIRQCATPKPNFMSYTSLCAPTVADFTAGRLVAQPSYYGLLAFRALGTGSWIGVDNTNWATLRAGAVKHGTSVSLMLVDVRDPASNNPQELHITLNGSYTRAVRTDLTTTSPAGLAGTDEITFGAQAVHANGTIATPATTAPSINKGVLNLTIQPGTATVIQLT